jgi:sugar phosphate isomerase/epimerase
MQIFVTDWGDAGRVAPLAQKYQVGMEVVEFTQPKNLENFASLVPEIKEKLQGISPLAVHAPFSELVPASRDPLVRQVARTRLQQGVAIAHGLVASHLVVHSGFFPKTYSRDTWVNNTVDFWEDFLAALPSPNFIHIENVYEDDYSTLCDLVDRVNEALGTDRLTICLDIGHVNANSSKPLAEWIEGLGDRIRYVHVHNNNGILDDHWRLDKGEIDVNGVLDLLVEHSPNATWTVETVSEDIEPSLVWLKERGYL